jgi:hypothetical protein
MEIEQKKSFDMDFSQMRFFKQSPVPDVKKVYACLSRMAKRANTGQPPPGKRPRERDITKRKSPPTSDDETKTKVTRTDVHQRKVLNRGADFPVVKASLRGRFGTFCPPLVQDIFHELVNSYVYTVSQMVVRGSMVANEALLQYMRQGQPPVISSTFFRHCMTGRSTDPIIASVIQQEFADHPEIVEPTGTGFVLNYAANLYTTAFDNHLWMPFESRFKGYVKDWIAVNHVGEECIGPMICIILGRSHARPIVLQREVWEFIDRESAMLGNPVNFHAENVSQSLLLEYTFRMLEFKRLHGRARGFSIAPLHKVRRHHITIDTTVLHVMIQEVFRRLQDDAPEWIQEIALMEHHQAIHEARDVMWSRIVDWTGLSRKDFHYRLLTNGVEASFVFSCPKREEKPVSSVTDIDQHPHIISVDPGRTNLVTAWDQQNDKFFTFTRRGYYASIRNSLEKIRWWETEILDINMELSMFSLRTCDEDLCRGYRRVYFKQYRRLWTSRYHVRRAKEAFHIYSVKRSVLDRFFMSFMKKGQAKPVVLYGAASVRPGGPGEMCVPVKKILQRCKRFYTTYMVNEHLTTQCHSKCGSRMHPVKNRLDPKPTRGLKYCRMCQEFVNRDRDASVSINHAGVNAQRPEYLSFTRPYEYKEPLTLLPPKAEKQIAYQQ